MGGLGVIATVVRKELIQTMRDRRMLPLLLVAPLMQTLVFGFAVNLDLADQPVVIADHDGTDASRDVVQAVRNAESYEAFVASLAGRRPYPDPDVYDDEDG